MFRKRGIIYPYIWKFNEIVDGKKAPRLFIIQLGLDLGVVLALCKLHLFFIWNNLLPPSQPLFPAMPGNIWLQLGIYGSNRAAMTGAVLCQLTAVFFFPKALRACSQGNIDIWDRGMENQAVSCWSCYQGYLFQQLSPAGLLKVVPLFPHSPVNVPHHIFH